jgi:hypothetical protein
LIAITYTPSSGTSVTADAIARGESLGANKMG